MNTGSKEDAVAEVFRDKGYKCQNIGPAKTRVHTGLNDAVARDLKILVDDPVKLLSSGLPDLTLFKLKSLAELKSQFEEYTVDDRSNQITVRLSDESRLTQEIRFVEVKTRGQDLKPNQKAWFDRYSDKFTTRVAVWSKKEIKIYEDAEMENLLKSIKNEY